MALTRALAVDGEQIEDSELSVTSALALNVKAFLPAIEEGTGATVAAGYQVLVQANAAGDVEIVDVFGRRVVMVQAGESASVKANGDVNRPVWTVSPAAAKLAMGTAATAAGSTTPVLGTTAPTVGTVAKYVPIQMLDGTIAFIATWV